MSIADDRVSSGKPVIPVSVRTLVEFVWKSGSIRTEGVALVENMQLGSAVHRRLQKLAHEDETTYASEVRCGQTYDAGDLILEVRGSIDGVSRKNGVRVDEIKSVSIPASAVDPADNALHWAQAKCYGHFLCTDESLPAIDIQVIYYELKTGDITRERRTETAADLSAFFTETCERYAVWLRWQLAHHAARNASAKQLTFPFDFRRGQRTVSAGVYRAVRDRGSLYVQAPTGIGKTLAVLFPAVKAQGEGMGEILFYLTAKTVTRAAAMQALHRLEQGGLDYRAVQLTAKEKLCPHGLRCDPVSCPLANGYYDRVNDAVMELLTQETLVTPEVLNTYSVRYSLCPFELSLDLSSWCDCVVGDYNHLFDPVAHLARFFGGEPTDHVVLIDEAHNLAERGRETYSAELSRRAIDDVSRLVKTDFPKLHKKLRKLASPFRAQSKLMKTPPDENGKSEKLDTAQTPYPVDLVEAANSFRETYTALLRDESFDKYKDATLAFFFQVSFLTVIASFYDEHYTTCWERQGGDLLVRLYCIDPSLLLRKHYQLCRSAILFSATLLPGEYYRHVLSDEPIPETAVPSPFPHENQLVLIGERVSTRYRDRAASYDTVADYIRRAVSHKTGNYLVFFPSFAYQRQILEHWEEEDCQLLVQESGMDEQARADFLAEFEQFGDRTRIGMCVVGGIFAEGIDLVGERLSGAIVVGVGLPTVSFQRDIIRDYYDQTGRGYLYAYQYPGLNRVFQAAGRVIRSETDRGFVLLLDDRFASGAYVSQYPAHWENNLRIRTPEQLDRALETFWSEAPDLP